MTAANFTGFEDPAHYRGGHFQRGTPDARRFAWTAAMIPSSVISVLDLGCGDGSFLAHLETLAPNLATLGCERARAAVRARTCRARIAIGDIGRVPFADASVDCSCALEVLEHLPDNLHRAALSELGRVTRRFALVSVPWRERRIRIRCRRCSRAWHPYEHLRSYSRHRMIHLLPGFRCRILKQLRIDSDPLGATLLRYLLQASPWYHPAFATCPRCGHKAHAGSGRSDPHDQPTAGFRRHLPRIARSEWWLALYERGTPLAGGS